MVKKKNTLLTVKLSDAKDIGVFYAVLQIKITDIDGKYTVVIESKDFSYPRMQLGSDIVDETLSDNISSDLQVNNSSVVSGTSSTQLNSTPSTESKPSSSEASSSQNNSSASSTSSKETPVV